MKWEAPLAENLPPDKRDEYNTMFWEATNIVLASSAEDIVLGEAGARFAALHEKMQRFLIQYGGMPRQGRRKIRCWHFVGRRV